MEVYIENSINTFSSIDGFQRKMQGFISCDFISEEALFTFPFSRMGLGLAMWADGGRVLAGFIRQRDISGTRSFQQPETRLKHFRIKNKSL